MVYTTGPSSHSSPFSKSQSVSSVEIITESWETALRASISEMFSEKSLIAKSTIEDPLENQKRKDREYHEQFLAKLNSESGSARTNVNEEHRTVPLFSGPVLDHSRESTFRQYGLLAGEIPKARQVDLLGSTGPATPYRSEQEDRRIFLNVSPPWSSFICGSQGSGKSHTLSCMMEDCLVASKLGKLPNPLTGLVFHYDKFTSYSGNQLCEAAYLCSSGIPVKVLVSKTNEYNMRKKYSNLPGLPKNSPKPEVIPLAFRDNQLDVSRMMILMAVSDKDGPTPLYVETIIRILRQMAIANGGRRGLDYAQFRRKLDMEGFTTSQSGPLKLRLDLLESMMDKSPVGDRAKKHDHAWEFNPGGLTIVDLSCPFVDENAACALFSICLELFIENRGNTGRVVALDEAHKFMTSTPSAITFTDTLLDIIRQQRHLATRVIIATQEPTISPKLLDLASMTIVHRFTSPEWLKSLQGHLAGASGSVADGDGGSDGAVSSGKRNVANLFSEIVRLDAGEALLFCPSAMLEWKVESTDATVNNVEEGVRQMSMGGLRDEYEAPQLGEEHIPLGEKRGLKPKGMPVKLGMKYVKIRVRQRLTADGGKSVMAE